MKVSKELILGTTVFIILLILASSIIIESNIQRAKFLISSFGMLSLLGILFILIVPIAYSKYPSPLTSSLLSNRKWIGLSVFIFAATHVILVQLNYFNFDISKIINNPKFLGLFAGMLAFTILSILAITSHDKIIRLLGKNWKYLHRFGVYIAAFIILIHIWINGGFWTSNMLIKIIVTAVVVLLLSYKILNLNIKINRQNE